ncbi:MAG: outer membrane beta-barrel protein [Gammaproteobacteria bacterium]|jgi:opacity protein-like surface antigen
MKKLMVMMAALFICPSSEAGNWYVGAGLGLGHAKDASQNAAANNSTLSRYGINYITSHDDNSGTLSLFGGYHFSPYIAAELGYTYLGSYDMHGFAAPGPTLPAGHEENRVDAFSLAAVLSAPINRSFTLYGKLGPTLTTNDQRTCVSNLWWCDTSSDVKTGLLAGVGASMALPKLIGRLRLEVDGYNHVGDSQDEFTAGRFSVVQLQYVYPY